MPGLGCWVGRTDRCPKGGVRDGLKALSGLDSVDLIRTCIWSPVALTGPCHQALRKEGPTSEGLLDPDSCH